MNHGEWIGSKIHESNKMLILGESHYGDENGTNESMGKPVPSIALQKDIESHQCLYFFVWPDSNPGFEVSAPLRSVQYRRPLDVVNPVYRSYKNPDF